MKRYHHYIWDFDGTLFDSYPHSTRALYVTARHYGAEVGYDEVSRAIRHSFARAFALVGLTDEQLSMFHRLRGDDAFPPPIVPFPHAEAVLRALYEGGARHTLYTHSNHKMSVRFLRQYGLDMRGARDAGGDGILVDPDRRVAETCARYRADDLMEIIL